MGTLYFGPYHEEIDTYSHEGYAARVMPDGGETSSWTGPHDTGHVGYRARCACGWGGTTIYPVPDPDPMDCEAATDEWRREHIAPLVEQAGHTFWPDWQRHTSERAAAVSGHIAAGRYRYALDALARMREDLEARARTVEQLADDDGA